MREISVAFLHEDALLKTARNHFHSFHFHGAARTLEAFAGACRNSSRREKALHLACYCNALGLWDDYRLKSAKDEMLKVLNQFPYLEDQYKMMCNLVDDQRRTKTEESLLILADLFFSASRSLKRGQYADTLARVIRTYEGLLKWRLLHKFKTPAKLGDMDPDIRKKVEEYLIENGCRVDRKGYLMSHNIEMLLQNYYQDEDVVKWQKDMRRFISARNQSIVAHGTEEVKEKTARNALQSLREILKDNSANINGYPLSDENLTKYADELFSNLC